jgi:hypothetical protein
MQRAEHVSRLPEADELLEILSHELADLALGPPEFFA